VPSDGQLEFYAYQGTDDELEYAWQSAQVLNTSGTVLTTLYKVANNTQAWTLEGPYSLSAYAGESVQIKFLVHGNGYSSTYIYQYIDAVSLTSGVPPTTSPTTSPTSSPTTSPTTSPTASPTATPTTKPTTSPTASPTASPTSSPGTSPIKHVVIILQENRTTDNLFHGYPGVNYATTGTDSNGDTVTPQAIALINPWDPSHQYSNWVTEYNGGAMNGFNLDSLDYGSGAPTDFAYDYAQQSDVQPYWNLAQEGVVTDNSFTDHRSQSYPGHLYPIAGASGPVSSSEPDEYFSEDPSGGESCADPGTAETINIVTGVENGTAETCIDINTLGDLLTAKSLSWKYYVPSADKLDYVSAYSGIKHVYDGPEWANVVTPATTAISDAEAGTLPSVSWVIGTFADSDHDGQNVPSSNGPNWVTSVVNAIGKGPDWSSTAVFITWDDWGGWYDHVAPEQNFDAFEPGFRVPIIIVSPYAVRGYVSHDLHYTGSILHYIENNFGLGSLGTADARSDALADCFNYSQAPLSYITVTTSGNPAALVDSDLPWYGDRHPVDPEQRD
jgi:phospholipase C